MPAELFTVPEGLEVTLWATSPMLFNPTNIDFDAQGRLYVAEGVNYRGKGGRRKEGDRIVVLEDTDQDGKADKSSVFVQEPALASPLGVAVIDGKVVVSQPPDLLVYSDADGDLKPEKREVLLTGENLSDAQAGFDSQTQEAAVHLTLDAKGARVFRDVTRENVGKRMAIILFEKGRGEVVTAPVIRGEIGGGRVQISGAMNTVEANDIALLLRAAAAGLIDPEHHEIPLPPWKREREQECPDEIPDLRKVGWMAGELQVPGRLKGEFHRNPNASRVESSWAGASFRWERSPA